MCSLLNVKYISNYSNVFKSTKQSYRYLEIKESLRELPTLLWFITHYCFHHSAFRRLRASYAPIIRASVNNITSFTTCFTLVTDNRMG